jgi:hypothetical protein
MSPGDHAQSLGLSVKRRMFEKPPDEVCRFPSTYVQPNQAVTCMGPIRPVKILIQAEECRPRQMVQNWKYILIFRTPGSHIHANEAEVNSPFTQQ